MSFFERQPLDLSFRTSTSTGPTIPALKEWAVVCKALEKGRQIILLRKGGIMEYRNGFEVKHNDFFLYPTFEHQSKEYLQDDYIDELDIILRNAPQNNKNRLTTFAKVVEVAETIDGEVLRRLGKYHIWNDHYVNVRLNYNPKRPMSVVILRVYKMGQPLEIEDRPEFAGCKSWIPIPLSYSEGALSPEREKIRGTPPDGLESLIDHSQPVLDDSEFDNMVVNILEALE